MPKQLKQQKYYDPIFNRLIAISYTKGLSPSAVSDGVGASRSVLNAWKKGNIAANKVKPICDLLGISIEYFITGKDGSKVESIAENATGEFENEVLSILTGLDSRSKTEILNMIYRYLDGKKENSPEQNQD